MNLSAYWRILRDVQDLDPTAKFALTVIAAYAEREATSATVNLGQFESALSISDAGTVKALARVIDSEWAAVDNSGGKLWVCQLGSRLSATPVRTERDSSMNRAQDLADRAVLSLKELRVKELSGDGTAATPHGAAPPPVENGAHGDTCRCGGTGWVETVPGQATRCIGLRVVE